MTRFRPREARMASRACDKETLFQAHFRLVWLILVIIYLWHLEMKHLLNLWLNYLRSVPFFRNAFILAEEFLLSFLSNKSLTRELDEELNVIMWKEFFSGEFIHMNRFFTIFFVIFPQPQLRTQTETLNTSSEPRPPRDQTSNEIRRSWLCTLSDTILKAFVCSRFLSLKQLNKKGQKWIEP